MMAEISVAGVTSNAGLYTGEPSGAVACAPTRRTSPASRSSIGMWAPEGSVGRAADAGRGTVARRGERAGVAVGQDARARRNQRGAVVAHRAIGGDVLVEDRLRFLEQPRARLVQRPLASGLQRAPHALQCPE